MEEYVIIKNKEGYQWAFMPDGTIIPKQVKTIVIDDCNKGGTGDNHIVKVHITLFAKLK